MKIGVVIGALEAVGGLATGNPAMIVDGARRAVKSYAIGELTAPIMEPIKDAVGDFYSDVDWAEVAENCPFW